MNRNQIKDFFMQKRIITVVLAGIFVILFLSFLVREKTQTALTPPPPTPQTEVKQAAPQPSPSTAVDQPPRAVRNPFAPPVSKEPPAANAKIVQASEISSSDRNKVQNIPPRLTGIINSQNQSIAIIEYHSQSHYVKINDHLGPYVLTKLSINQVTLLGSDGELTLQLGR